MKRVGEETAKTYQQKIESGFWDRYIKGYKVLEIGYKGYQEGVEPILNAIGVDLDYPGYDGLHLPFPDQSQDAVYSSHTLEHIEFWRRAIKEWFRVTRIGGHVIIVVPHRELYERRATPPSRWNEDHKRFYTPISLLSEVATALNTAEYRIRHLCENDDGYDYSLPADVHPVGCYEIELVIERIK